MATLAAVAAEGPGVLCVHGDVLEELFREGRPKGSATLVDEGLRPIATIPPPA